LNTLLKDDKKIKTHLKLRQRKLLPKTGSRSVYECDYMTMPLNLLRSQRVVVQRQPSLRLKFLGVWAPEDLGSVHALDRHGDKGALGDCDAVDHLS
jgi:hypothetical protein